MSQFDPTRFKIEDPAAEIRERVELMIRILEKIEKNTQRRKPGRPRKERSGE